MKPFVTALALIGVAVTNSVVHAQAVPNSSSAFISRTSANRFTSDTMRNSLMNRSIPQYTTANVNRGPVANGNAARPAQRAKPFSSVSRGPSTSPYMGMVAQHPFSSSTSNYFNIVKPQLDAQRANEKLQAQNIRLQQQLTEAASKGPYSATGSEDRAPTGHAAVYMNPGGVFGNPGGYYPQVPVRSVRGQR